ncbi:MAG: hydrogenase maturation nickel metallochaperone HypA [Lachnospiraceae bacterium]|jgi:hydrogenase nickel incorporation protein HypA/HybF|nr:hydrogenase maturation nickel metallochaperone HypA [Lachnospiraceae bacterium]MDD6666838.1 hydrogenase maturation nickel metallochaperone HypA [Lachnospiraceae bacterium]
MHEMGIVLHLADTLDQAAKENHITKYGSVTLSVGEVSGIMTDYFEECWDYFKGRHPLLKDSKLKLETIKAITFCSNCERNYETVKYGKTCPYCGSGETWLITGNECLIKEVEAETDDGEEGVVEQEADNLV